MGKLEEKLKDCHLTTANRKIGEFCLQNRQTLPLLSSAEIARRVGVSDVSVIRFVKMLGYSSFAEFKRDIQCEVANLSSEQVSPIVSFFSKKADASQQDGAIECYQQIVSSVFEKNSKETFELVAKTILSSCNRYVLGLRFRSCVAELCANLLRMSTSNVIHIPPSDYAVFQYLMDFTQEDCLIWFSFGRFTNLERQILQAVKKSGIKLIVISDERASQSALAADVFIQSSGHTQMPFYSAVGICVVAEMIANTVNSIGWLGSEKRLRDYEANLQTSAIRSDTPTESF